MKAESIGLLESRAFWQNHAVAEIAKVFACLALDHVAFDDRGEQLQSIGRWHPPLTKNSRHAPLATRHPCFRTLMKRARRSAESCALQTFGDHLRRERLAELADLNPRTGQKIEAGAPAFH